MPCTLQRDREGFNPRSHAGSDRTCTLARGVPQVSIHAPTRGATKIDTLRHQKLRCFNPRSHAGSDKSVAVLNAISYVSIHAPTRGATHIHTTFY